MILSKIERLKSRNLNKSNNQLLPRNNPNRKSKRMKQNPNLSIIKLRPRLSLLNHFRNLRKLLPLKERLQTRQLRLILLFR